MKPIYQFDTALACKYGVEQAILIDFLNYALDRGTFFNQKLLDGKVWMCLQLDELEVYLQFWQGAYISKLLTSLIYHGVLAKRKLPELGRADSFAFVD